MERGWTSMVAESNTSRRTPKVSGSRPLSRGGRESDHQPKPAPVNRSGFARTGSPYAPRARRERVPGGRLPTPACQRRSGRRRVPPLLFSTNQRRGALWR